MHYVALKHSQQGPFYYRKKVPGLTQLFLPVCANIATSYLYKKRTMGCGHV